MALQRGEGDSPHQPSDNPDLAELVRLARRFAAMLIHTGLPGVVTAVTPASLETGMPLLVDVLPSFMPVFYDDDGSEKPSVPKPIPGCPVLSFNSGGFAIRVTPRVGDFGYLHVAERSLAAWYKSNGAPIEPPFDHLFSLSDCFFAPAGRPGPVPLQHGTMLSVGTDTGAAPGAELGEITIDPSGIVTVEGPTIRLGRGAAQPAVLGTDLVQQLLVFLADLSASVLVPDVAAAAATFAGVLGTVPPLSTKVITE